MADRFTKPRASPRRAARRPSRPLTKLIAAVEAIGAPVLIVGADGEVLHTNSNGQSFFAHAPQFLAAAKNPVPSAASPPAPAQVVGAPWKLTPRQAEVLDLVARGMTNASIADTLQISEGTVEFHVSKILDKAGVENRATLIARLHDL